LRDLLREGGLKECEESNHGGLWDQKEQPLFGKERVGQRTVYTFSGIARLGKEDRKGGKGSLQGRERKVKKGGRIQIAWKIQY